MNNWQKWLGVAACIAIIASCFMHWAFYPDVAKSFTGFDSLVPFKGKMIHYYGRPGYILCFFAGICLLFHLLPKVWAKRINLLFGALCMAFALKSYFTFTSAYVGNIPVKEAGIFLLMIGSILNVVAIVLVKMPGNSEAEMAAS
ncbi:MAG: hypothetical protein V4722_27050 [Bacteroidota bacterium]